MTNNTNKTIAETTWTFKMTLIQLFKKLFWSNQADLLSMF